MSRPDTDRLVAILRLALDPAATAAERSLAVERLRAALDRRHPGGNRTTSSPEPEDAERWARAEEARRANDQAKVDPRAAVRAQAAAATRRGKATASRARRLALLILAPIVLIVLLIFVARVLPLP
ncbi:MAG: hypothetical protein L0027_10340 [Candidatus Rokubacteria bacterium]|nr:hypothetical protein [Candidatus Rokubacteria bacterium]